MSNEYDLSLDGEILSPLKNEFDNMVQKLVDDMAQKNILTGEVTLTLKIDNTKKILNFDPMLRMPPKERLEPTFRYKVESNMRMKNSFKASIGGDRELLKDNKKGWFVRDIDNGQMNLFD